MEHIINLFIDSAIDRSDNSRALAYKWIKTTAQIDDYDVTDTIQLIHYGATK